MKYKVIKPFRDRENKLVTYLENEEYPKKGAPFVNEKRIKELVTKKYIIGEKLKEGKKDNGEKV